MQVKLYEIVLDWLIDTFPKHSFTSKFSPYIDRNKQLLQLISLGKVIEIDGRIICRVMDTELVPWINHFSLGPFHATDPEFFNKIKEWIEKDCIPSLRDI